MSKYSSWDLGDYSRNKRKEENTIFHNVTGRKVKFQVPGNYFHKITVSPEVLLILIINGLTFKRTLLKYVKLDTLDEYGPEI